MSSAIPSKCSKCGSDNIQRAGVIWESGSGYSEGTSSSVTYGNSDSYDDTDGSERRHMSAVTYGRSYSQSSSLLAQRCAPPAEPVDPGGIGFLPFGLVGGGLILSIPLWIKICDRPDGLIKDIASIITVVLSIVLAFLVFRAEAKEAQKRRRQYEKACEAYPAQLAKYEATWFCHRCGNLFEAAPASSPRASALEKPETQATQEPAPATESEEIWAPAESDAPPADPAAGKGTPARNAPRAKPGPMRRRR